METKVKKKSPHHDFSVRAHLIRWFHERDTKELKAMQDAWFKMKAQPKKKQ